MAQIFVSHSSKDVASRTLLANAFAATNVRGMFEEFDAIAKGPADAARIRDDIRQSNAVFILLGTNVEALRHTRDWVGHEGGIAAETNKDIWVLEPITEADALSIVIPHFRHYVSFNPADERWQGYLTQIIASYDDSHFLKGMSAGAVTGAALAPREEMLGGIALGAFSGVLLAAFSSSTRPPGAPFRCPQCLSVYSVHLCANWLRCPVCNSRWQFA
ncbi:MAG TPA: hypothetical protein VHU83_06580 [Bryobacteraceae bacterium]|jgi:hypothetical protein|nr:hypothetical protein [Bryobacteraceae bacterium]